jgi:hypothetical protein
VPQRIFGTPVLTQRPQRFFAEGRGGTTGSLRPLREPLRPLRLSGSAPWSRLGRAGSSVRLFRIVYPSGANFGRAGLRPALSVSHPTGKNTPFVSSIPKAGRRPALRSLRLSPALDPSVVSFPFLSSNSNYRIWVDWRRIGVNCARKFRPRIAGWQIAVVFMTIRGRIRCLAAVSSAPVN